MKKVAIVTGGNDGIGKAFVKALEKRGYTVEKCSRSKPELVDVTNYDSVFYFVKKTFEKHKRIDLLITCAGVSGPVGLFYDNDISSWKETIDINLVGTVNTIKATYPYMKRRQEGCIITMCGGGVGGKELKPDISAYITSKFAVAGFTEAISKELLGNGVYINAISPGAVETKIAKEHKTVGGNAEDAIKLMLFLVDNKEITGKVFSAKWDDYKNKKILKSLYNLRRIDDVFFEEKGVKK